jgi:hypothetical protein
MNLYLVIDKTAEEAVGMIHKDQQEALDAMMAYKIEHPDHELDIETMELAVGEYEVGRALMGDNHDEV